MANDYLSLADLTTINDANLADLEVSDLLQDAPFLAVAAAVPASNGELHKYAKTTGGPVVGFRSVNDGREHDSSVRTTVTVTLKLLDCSLTIDKAMSAYRGGLDALVEMELQEHLKAGYYKLEEQILNGTGADSNGFAGIADNGGLDGLSDDMVVGAGGSTACSSVYFVRMGPNDFSVVAGNDGNMDVGAPVEQRVAGATGFYTAITQSVQGWFGVQIGSAQSVARIANIDAGSNKVDDDLLFDGLELFPVSRPPTHVVMNKRSLHQLRDSRTATNPTGAPAPVPTEWNGIPVITTEALGNAETALT